MPIYAYRCQTCGADAEYIQKFSDPPVTVCEACGGALERAVTAAAFHLKGGGWYKDGYASAKAEGGKSEGGEAKGDAKADSKPAETKTESKPAASSDSGGSTASSTKAAAE
jgi:putative FmdB family regulatory protein